MGQTRRGGAPGLWARAHIERCQRRTACARNAPEEWATWPHVGARAGTLSPRRGGTHRDSLGDATFDVRFVNYVNTKEGRTKVNERLRIGLLPWQVVDDNLASAVQQSQACGRAQARRPPRDHEDAALDLRPRGVVSPESSQDSRARASLSPSLSPCPTVQDRALGRGVDLRSTLESAPSSAGDRLLRGSERGQRWPHFKPWRSQEAHADAKPS